MPSIDDPKDPRSLEEIVSSWGTDPDLARIARENEERHAQRLRAIAEEDWRQKCPTDLHVTDWEDPRLKPYQAQIKRILAWQPGKRGIYAVGRSGRGKSRSLWALVRRLMGAGEQVRILTQSEVTRLFNRDTKLFLDEMDVLATVPILAWDDWGKFDVIGARQAALHAEIEALIDVRTANGRPMLLTTNLTHEHIIERFGPVRGEPILRRLSESCQVIEFGW